MLPVQGYPTPILPPPFKQLNIRPDGGTGPIPLHTGWTLGGVPKHMSNWAAAAQAAAAQAAGGGGGGGGSGGMFGPQAAATAAALAGGKDPVLTDIVSGMPDASLPLVPGPDKTFVSRDTCVTGARGMAFDGSESIGWLGGGRK